MALTSDHRVERPAKDISEDFVRGAFFLGDVTNRRVDHSEREVGAFQPLLMQS